MECIRCKTSNPQGQKFCGDCGFPLGSVITNEINTFLNTVLLKQVETVIKEKIGDQRVAELEVTERALGKLKEYGKMLVYVVGIPVALFAIVLGILGFKSYSDFREFINDSRKDLQTQVDGSKQDLTHLRAKIELEQGELPYLHDALREIRQGLGELTNEAERRKQLQKDNKVLGVNVSSFKGNIDWAKTKASGIFFAYIKATEGTDFKDPLFSGNWKSCKAAGILRGAYTVFRPDQDPNQQADLFVKAVEVTQQGWGDLPPVVAVKGFTLRENSSGDLRILLRAIEQKYHRKPMIYTSALFWQAYSKSGSFADYPLWISQTIGSQPSNLPQGWSTWTFWQFSQSSTVDGIDEIVDLDAFNGSYEQLLAYSRGERPR